MSYRIKEIVYTLQGEGANSGKAVVLCRFEGCNLNCSFCDTDYQGIDGPGGGEFASAAELAQAAWKRWIGEIGHPRVLCTGGEPLLQLDEQLTAALHLKGFEILLETNGTIELPDGIDWVCVSPKEGRETVVKKGNELKLAFPQRNVDPRRYLPLDFDHFYLQPISGIDLSSNTRRAVEYCLDNPRWALSLQIHKFIGIP
ncbi:MAG: 7-carboxy-7-deazaguanine synthase [Candidatus Aegiribacteria sp.]|nr:7-carboxy-7-deazaguanine synthase [Candidatus Aegiribacteria sp.]